MYFSARAPWPKVCTLVGRDRDVLLIIFVGCRSVHVAVPVEFLTESLLPAAPVVLPMSLGPSPCNSMGAVTVFRRSRCARGVGDRASPYHRRLGGVSEALPRRRRCKASAPVLRARSRSRRECHAAGRGRARLVQAGLAAFGRDQITTGRASASGCTPGDEGLPREQGRWLRQPQRLETAVPWTIAEKDPSRLAAPGSGRSMWAEPRRAILDG